MGKEHKIVTNTKCGEENKGDMTLKSIISDRTDDDVVILDRLDC